MSKKPKVYIILLNWNGWEDTIECLESVLQNAYDNYQIIVCDNGSTDFSIDKMKQWADGILPANATNINGIDVGGICKKPISHIEITMQEVANEKYCFEEKIIFIKIGKNLGFAGGNNLGLQLALLQSDIEYVWLLNNDTVICKDTLSRLVDKISKDSSIGICGSKLMYYYFPERIQAVGGKYNKILGTSGHIIDEKDLCDMDYVVGTSMLVSKDFLKSVGLMAEEYFLYYEEMDWAVRAKGKFQLMCALDSVVYHKEGASIGGSNQDINNKSEIADYYSIRNRIIFTKKHFKKYLPTVYMGLVVSIINRIRRRQFKRVKMIFKIIFNI